MYISKPSAGGGQAVCLGQWVQVQWETLSQNTRCVTSRKDSQHHLDAHVRECIHAPHRDIHNTARTPGSIYLWSEEKSLWVWCLWLSGNSLLGTAFEVSGESLWAGMGSGAQQEPVPSSHTAWGHMFDTSPLLSPVHVSNPDCSLQNLWSLGDHHRPSTRWLTQVPV